MKNKFINTVENYRAKAKEINDKINYNNAMYKREVVENINKKLLDELNILELDTKLKLIEIRDTEINNQLKLKKDNIKGENITDDIKLLNHNIKLNREELQDLYNKYEENEIMKRAIENYCSDKDIIINVKENIFDTRIKEINTIYDYSDNYKNENMWDTVKVEVLEKLSI